MWPDSDHYASGFITATAVSATSPIAAMWRSFCLPSSRWQECSAGA